MPSSTTHPKFTTPPPPHSPTIILSFPCPSILLITLNRPKALNSLTTAASHELSAIYTWLDHEPSLTSAILTGTGRAFCAGADLKEWQVQNSARNNPSKSSIPSTRNSIPPSGFGGLSRRGGKKPVICAVNGIAFGGGCEMVINADLVIADSKATFALPEVKRGVVALAGAIPRLARAVGRIRALEMLLTGRVLSAEEAREWGLVNCVVGCEGKGDNDGKEVVKEAIRFAEMIAANSPDAVIVSREGVKLAGEGMGVEDATRRIVEEWYPRIDGGENMNEGLRAFVEKRRPRWVNSRL